MRFVTGAPQWKISLSHGAAWEGVLNANADSLLLSFSFPVVPPNIYGSEELSRLTVMEGALISLLCESNGVPPPNLLWKKKGQCFSWKIQKPKYLGETNTPAHSHIFLVFVD